MVVSFYSLDTTPPTVAPSSPSRRCSLLETRLHSDALFVSSFSLLFLLLLFYSSCSVFSPLLLFLLQALAFPIFCHNVQREKEIQEAKLRTFARLFLTFVLFRKLAQLFKFIFGSFSSCSSFSLRFYLCLSFCFGFFFGFGLCLIILSFSFCLGSLH